MKCKILGSYGLDIACNAIGLSFAVKSEDNPESNSKLTKDKAIVLLKNLVTKGDSHAKVLRMAMVWLDITAPRYWWQEFDTYKIGTVTMSESTMHTLLKRYISKTDFEDPIPTAFIDEINKYIKDKDLIKVKAILPESFLQKRIVCLNYQTLRHIYLDRKNHKLPQWKFFIENVIYKLPHYELIIQEENHD